jgi:hypothetical protein
MPRSPRSSWADPRALALVLVVAAAATTGSLASCQAAGCDTAPESNPPSDYNGGKVLIDGGPYLTSEPDERHINFGAGAQVRVHHGLGGRPQTIELWVSHSPTGLQGGNEVVPAGDMAQVICVNDDFVLVRNNTCDELYLRVVARDPEAPRNGTGALDTTCPK